MTEALPTGAHFALIGHPASYDHFVRLMKATGGEAAADRLMEHRKSFGKLIEWMPPYFSRHAIAFDAGGVEVHGKLIICPILPEALQSLAAIKQAYAKVLQACRMAVDAGARVISLGGFTSIVLRGRDPDIAGVTITTGASLTAALAVAQLETAFADQARDFSAEPITIIGATGDVGSIVTALLAAKGCRLNLVARTQADLENLQASLPAGDITLATHPNAAISQSGAIVAATNASSGLFDLGELAANTILCDIGYPKTFANAHPEGGRISQVFAGGIAQFPHDLGLQDYSELKTGNLLFGCFTEGMILAAVTKTETRGLHLASAERARGLFEQAQRFGIAPGPVA